MRHANEVPRHVPRRSEPLAARADPWVEGGRLVLEDVEIRASETAFPDRREKRLLVHRVAAPDVDDDALLRKASDKPRIEKIIRAGVGGKREDKPVGAAKKRDGDF